MLLLIPLLAAGCYNEGLPIYDLHGRIVLPEEATNRTTDDGNVITDDVRLIGPVYVGLYGSVKAGTANYPYPAVGPSFQAGISGDAYPYGGTTVGDIRFACMQALKCKTVSGRFVDFNDIVDWFDNQVNQPITDAFGQPVDTGDYIRQTCYNLFHYTSDSEIRVTATKDKNGDGKVDALDLDFTQRNDGKWEADFTIWQQQWYDGFSMWAWEDAPSQTEYKFSSCDPNDGDNIIYYNQDFFAGRQYRDVLNRPSQYIGTGDWVPSADPTGSDDPYVWKSPDEVHEIDLDYPVEF